MLSISTLLVTVLTLATSISAARVQHERVCYGLRLPTIPDSINLENRTVPFAPSSLVLPNGTTCCDNLLQIRDGVAAVDAQILQLLGVRSGYGREAVRFKPTFDGKFTPGIDGSGGSFSFMEIHFRGMFPWRGFFLGEMVFCLEEGIKRANESSSHHRSRSNCTGSPAIYRCGQHNSPCSAQGCGKGSI